MAAVGEAWLGSDSATRIEHMSALPPDLPRLQTLEIWLAESLREVRAAIARAEQQQATDASRRALPAPPPFVLSFLRAGGQPTADSVHLGDCRMASRHTRPLTREQAVQALAGGRVRACEICRPDTELGILD